VNGCPIAIPSYRRAETLPVKTWALLERWGVALERVEVFVADAEDETAYRKTLPSEVRLVRAVPGIQQVRNFIHCHYPDGERFISIDDDLQDVVERVDDKTTTPLMDFEALCDRGWAACEQTGARLWGVYPVPNPMFMKPRVNRELSYVPGCLYGVHNAQALLVTTDDKEDFERSILYYRAHGAIARIEDVALKTRYYKEPGGMQVERTAERVRRRAVYLAERYPEFCTLDTKKRSGHWEVRLRDKRPAARLRRKQRAATKAAQELALRARERDDNATQA